MDTIIFEMSPYIPRVMTKKSTNIPRLNLIVNVILAAVVLVTPVAEASGLDLHWLWHNRCEECHGHSADFARNFLDVSNGKLLGRHYVNDLRLFLNNHYLAGSDVDAVYDMLLAQVSTPPRFKAECSSCHDIAAQFARDNLEFFDGVLVSNVSKLPVRDFLNSHRYVETDSVDFYMALLTRIVQEIYRQ